jgi:hypothetical protein
MTETNKYNQSPSFISKRDKIKKMVRLNALLGNSSTRNKLSGQFNGLDNAPLTDLDKDRLNSALDQLESTVKDFRKELKKI